MNNILNKIAQMERNAEEVNLSSEKIELAKAEDLNKLFADAVSLANDLLGDTAGRVNALKQVLKQKEDKAIKLISNLDGALIDFEKRAKELGFDTSQSKTYVQSKKELDDLYRGVKYVTDIASALK
jgi:hypothetical protein